MRADYLLFPLRGEHGQLNESVAELLHLSWSGSGQDRDPRSSGGEEQDTRSFL
ncbi:hypothetical protein Krac_6213 [Ktedonobacter racemifer DSM 44963]|uniref:Uncharacterized protein n=1 Tax=Ktedonobacter racemifer DSM 44963 TaxID=485913 RepID=D6TY68_KTERA|nr:hypothetical protein Krac_6213 [Ktedonobacter racemifer DSM 44963]